jgi:hypothetical protein
MKNDEINHPSHYTSGSMSGIECWDHYELAMNTDEFRGAMKNNIYKYIFRQGKKDEVVKELKKARAYLDRWIAFEEGQRIDFIKVKPDPDGEMRVVGPEEGTNA